MEIRQSDVCVDNSNSMKESAIDGFRECCEISSVNVPEKLAPLHRAVECLVVSMAECELPIAMNNIASDTRSLLGIKRISALMFAKLVGPKDVIDFNPELYVRKWLASGRHIADDTESRKRDPSQVTTATYARFSNDINFIKQASRLHRIDARQLVAHRPTFVIYHVVSTALTNKVLLIFSIGLHKSSTYALLQST